MHNSSSCSLFSQKHVASLHKISDFKGRTNVMEAIANVPFGTFKVDLLVYIDMITPQYIADWCIMKKNNKNSSNLGTTLYHSFIIKKDRHDVKIMSTWQNYCYSPSTLTFKDAGYVNWLNRFNMLLLKLESGDIRSSTTKSIQSLFISSCNRKPSFKPYYFNDKDILRYHRNRFHNIDLSAELYV